MHHGHLLKRMQIAQQYCEKTARRTVMQRTSNGAVCGTATDTAE